MNAFKKRSFTFEMCEIKEFALHLVKKYSVVGTHIVDMEKYINLVSEALYEYMKKFPKTPFYDIEHIDELYKKNSDMFDSLYDVATEVEGYCGPERDSRDSNMDNIMWTIYNFNKK